MCTEEKLHLILDHCETLYKRLWSKKTFRVHVDGNKGIFAVILQPLRFILGVLRGGICGLNEG